MCHARPARRRSRRRAGRVACAPGSLAARHPTGAGDRDNLTGHHGGFELLGRHSDLVAVRAAVDHAGGAVEPADVDDGPLLVDAPGGGAEFGVALAGSDEGCGGGLAFGGEGCRCHWCSPPGDRFRWASRLRPFPVRSPVMSYCLGSPGRTSGISPPFCELVLFGHYVISLTLPIDYLK